jgi:hypothetical protein
MLIAFKKENHRSFEHDHKNRGPASQQAHKPLLQKVIIARDWSKFAVLHQQR